MLKFLIPNGSLSEPLGRYLGVAGYSIGKPDRTGFCGEANGVAFFQLDRRMVPAFIASGSFDAGITGYDLLIESGVCVKSVAELCFSRTTNRPTHWVLAARSPYLGPQALHATWRIGCELPHLADLILKAVSLPLRYEIVRIEGSEEMCVTGGLVDMVLVVTETGSSLVTHQLSVFEGIADRDDIEGEADFDCLFRLRNPLLVSMPRILARMDLEPQKEEVLRGLSLALQAAIGAQAFVMVTFDLPAAVDVTALSLPASVAPTVSPLLPPSEWKACEICIPRTDFGPLLPRLKAVGARAIVLREVQGYLP